MRFGCLCPLRVELGPRERLAFGRQASDFDHWDGSRDRPRRQALVCGQIQTVAPVNDAGFARAAAGGGLKAIIDRRVGLEQRTAKSSTARSVAHSDWAAASTWPRPGPPLKERPLVAASDGRGRRGRRPRLQGAALRRTKLRVRGEETSYDSSILELF